MADNRKKILEKIKALQAKTLENGCTEAEALSAVEMAASLMDQYGFSAMDLAESEQEPITENAFYAPGKNLKECNLLATAIAAFCDCKVWCHRAPRWNDRKSAIVYFGRDSDAATANYLTHLLVNACERAWREFQETPAYAARTVDGRVLRTSFMAGMVRRLNSRLAEMKDARGKVHDVASGKTGQDLVIVKGQEVDRAFNALNMKLKAAIKTKTQLQDANAYNQGVLAANSVAITPGVAGKDALQIA